MPPKGHATLGPSAAHRWLVCTGSVALAEHAPPEGLSPHAEEGTAAHAMAEYEARYRLDRGDPDAREAAYAAAQARWRNRWGGQYDEDDMRQHVNAYVDAVEEAYDTTPGSVALLEQRMETGIPGCWGTGDAVIIGPDSIHVLDLKYGRGVPVDAASNPQLRLYALGALNTFDGLLGDIREVTTTVVQPRLGSTSSETISAQALRYWRDTTVQPAVDAIRTGTTVLRPGVKQCRWCPVAGECRARTEQVTSTDFSRPADLLTDVELANALHKVEEARLWCDATQKTALHRIYDEGAHVPGWKVVQSAGRRTIPDQAGALAALEAVGFDPDDVSTRKLLSLSALEKKVGAEALDGWVVRSEGKPSLVPEGDRRPSVSGVVADFG